MTTDTTTTRSDASLRAALLHFLTTAHSLGLDPSEDQIARGVSLSKARSVSRGPIRRVLNDLIDEHVVAKVADGNNRRPALYEVLMLAGTPTEVALIKEHYASR